jgi:Holliday junction resolvasome RuvABC DNA-binding subunit
LVSISTVANKAPKANSKMIKKLREMGYSNEEIESMHEALKIDIVRSADLGYNC